MWLVLGIGGGLASTNAVSVRYDIWSLGPRMVSGARPRSSNATLILAFCCGPPRALGKARAVTAKTMTMKTGHNEMNGFQEILERKVADLLHTVRRRDGIIIEKSADQMDEIQYATERDLAIRNVDRESNLLRDVKEALRRIHEGSFGTCLECESAISPKRLAAVPWAACCIQCQEAAERDRQNGTESLTATLLNAA